MPASSVLTNGPNASFGLPLPSGRWRAREADGARAGGRQRDVSVIIETGEARSHAPIDDALVALVPRAAAGDEIAFTRLVHAFHPDMTRVAYVICDGDRDLTQDAVQSAWTIAWTRLGSLRQPERVRAWLLSVTANEARQSLRRQRRATFVDFSFAEEAVAAPEAPSPALIDVGDMLRRLKPDERALVALRYAAGLDSHEIGQVLGMSASGVRSRLDRLLDRLRKELACE